MLTDEQLNRIKVLIDWATPEPLQRNLYDHGGGRMFREVSPEGKRTLVIDAYNEADRNFYFEALPNMQALVAEVEGLRAKLAETCALLNDFQGVIERGVNLMTNDQLGQWEGVRTWVEVAGDIESELDQWRASERAASR